MGEQGEGIVAQAKDLIQRGQYEEVTDLLEPWLVDKPDDADGWAVLGAAHFELARWTDAEQAARQVVRLRPDSAREWSNLGVVLRKLGQLEHAAAAQQRALDLDASYERASTEMRKLSRIERGRHRRIPAKTVPLPRKPRSRWPQWALVALGVLFVAALCVRPLMSRAPEQPAKSEQHHQEPPGSDLTSTSDRSVDSSGRSDLIMDVYAETTEPGEDGAHGSPSRIRAGQRASRLGKALYAKSSYQEAKRMFVLANEYAPELGDPERWIGACNTRIAEQSAVRRHPNPTPANQRTPRRGASRVDVAAGLRERGFLADAEWWERDNEIQDMNLPSDWEDVLLDLSQAEFELDKFNEEWETIRWRVP